MNSYFYDLHIHSCLSPCGDDDMTPSNIAGMAMLKGLQIAALTDHNTCKNCPAFLKACDVVGIAGIPGMELTTVEEIHLLCLFEKLEQAMLFSEAVDSHRFKIKNKPDIFGKQQIYGANDEICAVEEYLLINATDIQLDEAYSLVISHGGFICPAHVDKQSNGIIAILGDFPSDSNFRFAEFSKKSNLREYLNKYPSLNKCSFIFNSDAHYLENINEAENSIELDCDKTDSDSVKKAFFRQFLMKGGNNK